MKNIKKIVILLIILILIAIVILVSIMKFGYNKEENDPKKDNIQGTQNTETNVLEAVTDRSTFFNVKNYVEKYYTAIQNLWYDNSEYKVYAGEKPAEKIQMSSYFAENLYSMLGKKYTETNNITINNIGSTFKYTTKMKTIITDIFSYKITENFNVYLVKGYNWNYKMSTKEDINIAIAIDEANGHFGIYPTDYIEKLKIDQAKVGDNLKIEKDDFALEESEKNQYKKEIISTNSVVQEYIDLYKFNTNYDVEKAYESINEEFKNNKFGNLAEYKKYLENNLQTIEVDKYATDKTTDFTQYVCVTSKGKYFVINETAPMKYSVMLDPYTVNLETFIAKYNSSQETTKVAMNIEKVRQAINDKDYKYVYSKLNDTFRQNNFPTIDSLENYIKTNLFESNAFECEDIKQQNETYVFKIKVTALNGETSEEKELDIIMKLQEGTNFVMSFRKIN